MSNGNREMNTPTPLIKHAKCLYTCVVIIFYLIHIACGLLLQLSFKQFFQRNEQVIQHFKWSDSYYLVFWPVHFFTHRVFLFSINIIHPVFIMQIDKERSQSLQGGGTLISKIITAIRKPSKDHTFQQEQEPRRVKVINYCNGHVMHVFIYRVILVYLLLQ